MWGHQPPPHPALGSPTLSLCPPPQEDPTADTTGITTTRATAPRRPTMKGGGWDPRSGGIAGGPAVTAPSMGTPHPHRRPLSTALTPTALC